MAMRSRDLALIVMLTGLPACAAPRPRTPGSAARNAAGRADAAVARPIAPVGRIDEAPIDAPAAAGQALPPAPAPPGDEAPPDQAMPPQVTAMEPEPVIRQIGPATPPNVAAALQLIEEGRRLQGRGGRNQAREQFERAVAIDPTNAYGYFFLARVHFFNRTYDQAIAFASRAVALGGRLDPSWLGRVYALQGAVFEEAGRYPDARDAYRRAIAVDARNLAAQVGLGRVTGEAPDAPAQ